jgi:hypothetical protein
MFPKYFGLEMSWEMCELMQQSNKGMEPTPRALDTSDTVYSILAPVASEVPGAIPCPTPVPHVVEDDSL